MYFFARSILFDQKVCFKLRMRKWAQEDYVADPGFKPNFVESHALGSLHVR